MFAWSGTKSTITAAIYRRVRLWWLWRKSRNKWLVLEGRSTRRKPASLSLCSAQDPNDLTGARTRAPAVWKRRLTAWAAACPGCWLNWTEDQHTGRIEMKQIVLEDNDSLHIVLIISWIFSRVGCYRNAHSKCQAIVSARCGFIASQWVSVNGRRIADRVSTWWTRAHVSSALCHLTRAQSWSTVELADNCYSSGDWRLNPGPSRKAACRWAGRELQHRVHSIPLPKHFLMSCFLLRRLDC
jgi:hypothetical protein